MSRRSRLHYHLATIGYWASRIRARSPKPAGLLGDSLSFGAAVRYELPSHTTSRQNASGKPRQPPLFVRATAFRSWLPPIGPIKDLHLQSLRHARRTHRSLRSGVPCRGAIPEGYRLTSANLHAAQATRKQGCGRRRLGLLSRGSTTSKQNGCLPASNTCIFGRL